MNRKYSNNKYNLRYNLFNYKFYRPKFGKLRYRNGELFNYRKFRLISLDFIKFSFLSWFLKFNLKKALKLNKRKKFRIFFSRRIYLRHFLKFVTMAYRRKNEKINTNMYV